MLGHVVQRVLSKQKTLSVISTSSKKIPNHIMFNANDGVDSLGQIIKKCGPFDYIINCAGVLQIPKDDSKALENAIFINALLPHKLVEINRNNNTRIVHISTDGVFAKNSGTCLEDSPRNCDDLYGCTKVLGEVKSPKVLNIRCSIIGLSPYLKKGILEWFLSQPEGSELNGFTNQAWTGCTTIQLASLFKILLKNNNFDKVQEESPVHHFCPNETISKYGLLKLFQSYFRPDIVVNPIKNRANTVTRTLDTSFKTIKETFGYNKPMHLAIKEISLGGNNSLKK